MDFHQTQKGCFNDLKKKITFIKYFFLYQSGFNIRPSCSYALVLHHHCSFVIPELVGQASLWLLFAMNCASLIPEFSWNLNLCTVSIIYYTDILFRDICDVLLQRMWFGTSFDRRKLLEMTSDFRPIFMVRLQVYFCEVHLTLRVEQWVSGSLLNSNNAEHGWLSVATCSIPWDRAISLSVYELITN